MREKMRKKRKFVNEVYNGTPPEKDDGKKDKIAILVKKVGSRKYEPFFVGLAPIRLNGATAHVFGRPSEDGSDRQIEVAELVFRREKDLEAFVDFRLKLTNKFAKPTVVAAQPPPPGSAAALVAADARPPVPDVVVRKLKEEMMLYHLKHPCIKIDEQKFVKGC
jgi:hypothetical protein